MSTGERCDDDQEITRITQGQVCKKQKNLQRDHVVKTIQNSIFDHINAMFLIFLKTFCLKIILQVKVGNGLFNHLTAFIPACEQSGKRISQNIITFEPT